MTSGRGSELPSGAPAPSGTRSVLAALLLVGLTALAYAPALEGGFIWDDDAYVYENPTLRSAAGLRAIWLDPTANKQYYPLVYTTFWLEYRLWGLDPFGYHLTNLVLHSLSALLVWRLLRLLAVPGALLAAAVFALHPVHVESVAWVTERKNVLSGVLYLLSALAYLRYALVSPRRRWLLAASLALFVLALTSKTVAATLPAAVLLVLWWKRPPLGLRDGLPLVPFLLLGLGFGLVTAHLERTHVGATGAAFDLSFAERVLIAGRVVWFYLGKLLWPAELMFIYPRWSGAALDPRTFAAWIPPVAALAVLGALWALRGRLGRGPLVAALFFVGTLFPALGFFNVWPMKYSFVADHFQYLASLGPIALASAALVVWAARAGPAGAVLARATATLVVLALAVTTWQRGHAFADAETVWRDTIAKDPDSWMAHTALGALLEQRGAYTEAESHYRAAIAVKPDFELAQLDLGTTLAKQGRYAEAVPHLAEAIRLEPRATRTRIDLGIALTEMGRPEEGIVMLRRAQVDHPDDPALYVGFARAELARGRDELAVPHLLTRLQLLPDDPWATAELARLKAAHPEWSEPAPVTRRR
jgi:Flp pilus assembly protein TadD